MIPSIIYIGPGSIPSIIDEYWPEPMYPHSIEVKIDLSNLTGDHGCVMIIPTKEQYAKYTKEVPQEEGTREKGKSEAGSSSRGDS